MAAWPGCSHLGKGMVCEESRVFQTTSSIVVGHVMNHSQSPRTQMPLLTSPQRWPGAQECASVPPSSGSTASSGPGPCLLSVPFPGTPGAAAALEVTSGGSARVPTFKATTWTSPSSALQPTSLSHTTRLPPFLSMASFPGSRP